MKIEIRSKIAAEEFTCDAPWAAISISSDATRYANLNEANRIGLLQLTFADLSFRSLAYPEMSEMLFNQSVGRQILDFVDNVQSQIEVLLIHCEAGISRSAAVAAAVDKLYLKRENCKPYWETHRPNPLVYNTLVVMGVLEKRINVELTRDVSNHVEEVLAQIELEIGGSSGT